jgi:hypothetical protein
MGIISALGKIRKHPFEMWGKSNINPQNATEKIKIILTFL